MAEHRAGKQRPGIATPGALHLSVLTRLHPHTRSLHKQGGVTPLGRAESASERLLWLLALLRRAVTVADEAEAREIARSLNEDRRAMSKAERLPVETHLREQGHSYRAIAGAVGVDVAQVHDDLAGVDHSTPDRVTGRDGKSYPAHRLCAGR